MIPNFNLEHGTQVKRTWPADLEPKGAEPKGEKVEEEQM